MTQCHEHFILDSASARFLRFLLAQIFMICPVEGLRIGPDPFCMFDRHLTYANVYFRYRMPSYHLILCGLRKTTCLGVNHYRVSLKCHLRAVSDYLMSN